MSGKPKHVIAERTDLMEEWDFEENRQLNINPHVVGVGSHIKAWWICKKGHRWQTEIKARVSGIGCPYCANKKILKGFNDFATAYPKLAKQWHPTKNGSLAPDQVAPHSNKLVYWLCENGHEFKMTPVNRANGQNCPYCNNRRLLVGYNDLGTTHPNIAKEWDYSKNIGSPKDYTYRSMFKAHWKCSTCGNEWTAQIRDRVDSKYQLCPVCTLAKKGKERHNKLIKEHGGITDPQLIAEWDYSKNDKGPEEYRPLSNESVYWICSKCGYHFKAKINNRTLRKSCAACKGKVVVKGINDLATTHPKLAAEWHPTKNGDLRPTDVSYGMATQIWWVCSEGHEYKATLLHRSSGTNCPKCNSGRQTSFAEQAVFYYVRKVFPRAISRYKEIFSNGMELDIFIPSIKLAIEYDGEAWHKADKLNREKRKYQICQKHGIKLLRLKEKSSETDRYTADSVLSIRGNMYEHNQLAKVIRFLLDKIDPETNMWTRKTPFFHSKVDINIDRDEAEIRSYMTRLKNGSFAEKYPDLAIEWHPSKNGNLSPDKVKPQSDIKVWWKCPACSHEYYGTVGHRVSGTGCPKCGIMKSKQSKQKRVSMLDPNTSEVIRTFDSIVEASKVMGINNSNITMVCKGLRKKAGGYSWEYVT